jgi:23S rRNA (adenine2503-C2)-methyltransferase
VINFPVPTGNILVLDGDKGKKLECLSIGDYGKEKNIKADFLGLHNDINGVPNGNIMPLSEKWVVTISTQYGCSMGCTFCDVPKVGAGINCTVNDLNMQIVECLKLHPDIGSTKRLNIHYARMGEPTFNKGVLSASYDLRTTVKPYIGRSLVHPVVSTMLPKSNVFLMEFLSEWVSEIKNREYRGDAGLQFSINSTSDDQRNKMFSGSSLSLVKIASIGESLEKPVGRKFALNFAIADEYEVDPVKLSYLFDAKKFMVKITPIHATDACKSNGIKTSTGYHLYDSYRKTEELLKDQGFDTLVFVPSVEEDESGITCGNAILSKQ